MADDKELYRSGAQETSEPASSAPDTIVDKYGEPLLDLADEQSDDILESGAATIISPATMSYLTYGAYNADFRFGPPNVNAPIDESNPLPYWRLEQVQGGIEPVWIADSDSWSGYAIEWNLVNPAVDDEAYFEQIVPIDSAELWGHFRSILLPSVLQTYAMPSHDHFIEVEYYDAGGTSVGGGTRLAGGGGDVTGADFSGIYALGFDASSDAVYLQELPEDAKYAALRFGMVVTVAAEGHTKARVAEVFHKQPTVITLQYQVVNDNFSATATKTMYVPGDGDWTTLNAGTARYISQWPGFGIGVSTRHGSTRSAGNISLRGAVGSAEFGPSAQINSSYTQQRAATLPLGDSVTRDFAVNSALNGVATTSNWSASSTDENLGSVLLACFELMDYTT